jgi:hypothetical protein
MDSACSNPTPINIFNKTFIFCGDVTYATTNGFSVVISDYTYVVTSVVNKISVNITSVTVFNSIVLGLIDNVIHYTTNGYDWTSTYVNASYVNCSRSICISDKYYTTDIANWYVHSINNPVIYDWHIPAIFSEDKCYTVLNNNVVSYTKHYLIGNVLACNDKYCYSQEQKHLQTVIYKSNDLITWNSLKKDVYGSINAKSTNLIEIEYAIKFSDGIQAIG